MPDATEGMGGMPDDNSEPNVQKQLQEAQAEITRMRDALRVANGEAGDRRKELIRLKELEDAEALRNEQQKSELEKAQDAAQKANEKAAEALRTANRKLVQAKFIAEASRYGAKRPEDAFALAMADGVEISADDTDYEAQVAEAVKTLVEAERITLTGRPGAPNLDGGAGGGGRGERQVQLTPLQKELARIAGMTEEQYVKSMADNGESPASASLDQRSTLEKLLGAENNG